tara:strand:+ start:281 stop:505 length:225 start_codon:yes stop_codon:yes gene_type:complete
LLNAGQAADATEAIVPLMCVSPASNAAQPAADALGPDGKQFQHKSVENLGAGVVEVVVVEVEVDVVVVTGHPVG